jgi:hypothetical protein
MGCNQIEVVRRRRELNRKWREDWREEDDTSVHHGQWGTQRSLIETEVEGSPSPARTTPSDH